jgi:hypothetical protein
VIPDNYRFARIATSTEGYNMCNKVFAIFVAVLTVNLVCVSSANAQKKDLSVDEAKATIAKLGTGPKAAVRVTLKDNKKIQGWLSSADEEHFTVTAEKSGASTDIKYSDVRQVKSLRPSKSLVALVAVAVVGGAALVFLFAGAKH